MRSTSPTQWGLSAESTGAETTRPKGTLGIDEQGVTGPLARLADARIPFSGAKPDGIVTSTGTCP